MKTNIPVAKRKPQNDPVTDPKLAEELAIAVATELNDTDNLLTYQQYCLRFPEEVIKRALNAALTVPPERVKRSRLALFIYLLKKYAREAE